MTCDVTFERAISKLRQSGSEKDVYMFQADDKAGYKRCYPGILSGMTRNKFAFQAIESIRLDK